MSKDTDKPINLMKTLCPNPADCGAVKSLKERIRVLTEECCTATIQLAEKDAVIEALKGQLRNQSGKIFGVSSEKSKYLEDKSEEATKATELPGDQESHSCTQRQRGAVPGHTGHGRKIPETLKQVDIVHKLSPEEACCSKCGKPYRKTKIEKVSSEIDIEIVIVRRIHHRACYAQTCACESTPVIMTAAKTPQVIPKSMLSNSFWGYLLAQKYFFQIPLYRQITQIAMQGLPLLTGTVLGGFQKLLPLLKVLYEALIAVSRTESHWHADETRWLMFVDHPGKENYRWWLWTFVSEKVVAFVVDPNRSARVPQEYFGTDAKGTVNVDRYSAYHSLEDRIERALCWYHVRRDFVKAMEAFPQLANWSKKWMGEIDTLERSNETRLNCEPNTPDYHDAQADLEEKAAQFKECWEQELAQGDINKRQQTVLNSLRRNWDGLTVFVRNAAIPMHNNTAERALRSAALGRKNYYGHHAEWSGELSAICMTIFQTAAKHDLNVYAYIKYYFDICAQLGAAPENLDRVLPWNIPQTIIEQYNMWLKPSKKRRQRSKHVVT
jgi:transposase